MRHRRKHSRAYGVVFDESTTTPECVRVGQGASASPSAALPNHLATIQNLMKGCVINDAGVVQYYLDPTDRTLRENGAASDLTGGDGQVMVEIPIGWLKYSYANNEHTYIISAEQFNGASRLEAFNKNGSWVDNRYMGAYEGSMYDASAGAMVAPGNIAVTMYTPGDILCSLSGEFPKTNEARVKFREMAAQRGIGWRQPDYDLISAVQLLYLIEYASFYSQSIIGMGRTGLSGGTWIADSYIGQCGKSNGDGNGSNSVGGNTNAAYMTYRGIENFYGNVWNWVDGINNNSHTPYVSNTDTEFADDTSTNYTSLGITLATSNGYQNTLEQISRGFLPATVGASNSTKITDYYYQSTGWRAVLSGGNAADGVRAGVFDLNMSGIALNGNVSFGSRLSY